MAVKALAMRPNLRMIEAQLRESREPGQFRKTGVAGWACIRD